MRLILNVFQSIFLQLILLFICNIAFAKDTVHISENDKLNEKGIKYEIVSKPIEFKIFENTYTSKASVDNFLSNSNLPSNLLKEMGLIKTKGGYQIIEGGKYYQTFHSESEGQSSYSYIVLFLFILICLLVFLCLFTVFRFKWKKLDENKLVTFPEEAVNTMHTFLNAHETFIKQTNKFLESVTSELAKVVGEQNSKMGNLNEQLNAIRQLAEERGDELKRYKEGYDYANSKSLIMGIIDNIRNIEKYLLNQEIIKSPLTRYLEATKEKLELLLQSNGVEEYVPETGKLVSDVDGCRAVDTENTNDENLINVISSIKQKGYMITIDNKNSRIVKDAEVIVYSKGGNNGE